MHPALLTLGAHAPECYGSRFVCVRACVRAWVHACMCVCYYIFSDVAHLYVTVMIWISFPRYALECYMRDFSLKSFVRYLQRHLLTATSTGAIATSFCLILG